MDTNFSEFPTRPSLPGPPTPQDPPRPIAQPPTVLVYEKQRWEYKVVSRTADEDAHSSEAELNALGEDGWELVALVHGSSTAQFYLKRPRRR